MNFFFYVALNMLPNFKHVFLETMFLKSSLYKTLILIIRLMWMWYACLN